jgi:hypothetical protein
MIFFLFIKYLSLQESPEINSFQKLKTILHSISGKIIKQKSWRINYFVLDIQDIDSITFLTPFLDLIRSDEVSGPITCLALNAVNKFLSYGLIGRFLFYKFIHLVVVSFLFI